MSIITSLYNQVTQTPKYNKNKYIAGTIISGQYLNAKSDRIPLVLVLYSGLQQTKIRGQVHLTHAININFMSNFEKQVLFKVIISLSKSNFPVNMITFYDSIKGLTKKSYRTYFTAYLIGRVVSPGFYRAPLPIYQIRNSFIIELNNQLFGQNILHENAIRGEDEINRVIEETQNRSTRTIEGEENE
jgi:hypothetical protein